MYLALARDPGSKRHALLVKEKTHTRIILQNTKLAKYLKCLCESLHIAQIDKEPTFVPQKCPRKAI